MRPGGNSRVLTGITKKEGIPFEMGTIDSEIEIVNYLTENYQYCTGIESDKIVAANIDLDQVLQD